MTNIEGANFIENIPDNFWYMRFLDKYMEGHKGFIAGGCFKNILCKEQVKDIDIFFEDEHDFQNAVDYFNEMVDNPRANEPKWKFKYRNEKACAFQQKGSKIWVELIESVFGTPEEILNKFDFTVSKFAYFKKVVGNNAPDRRDIDEFSFFGKISEKLNTHIEYKLLYHKDYFEHLHQKRLVIDNQIPFPISTWERSYRYKGYGFNMCRETKKKLLEAIRQTTVDDEEVTFYLQGGWD